MTAVHITVPRSRLYSRLVLAGLAACGLAALAWAAFVQPSARIIYNASDSVPIGWYRIEPARSLPVGSIVLTTLPADAAALAAQRGYLPSHIPLLKRVGAIAPQHVCIVNDIVRIDGVPAAAVLSADRWNRPLPSWSQCRQLAQGELFLLSVTNPASFDSRYFGPIRIDAVIGVARPIRVEPQR